MSDVAGVKVLEADAGQDGEYIWLTTVTRTSMQPGQCCCTHVFFAGYFQLVNRKIIAGLQHKASPRIKLDVNRREATTWAPNWGDPFDFFRQIYQAKSRDINLLYSKNLVNISLQYVNPLPRYSDLSIFKMTEDPHVEFEN